MPVFMSNSAPEIKAKFDSPDFVENNEEMLKEEFTKYFQVKKYFLSTEFLEFLSFVELLKRNKSKANQSSLWTRLLKTSSTLLMERG